MHAAAAMMITVRFFVLATVSLWTSHSSGAPPQSISDLASHYEEIFQSGNRNAASHLWSAFILKDSKSYTSEQLETLFRGFCPISGSPLPDSPHTRFYVNLSDVSTGHESWGITHHCCWPCICDEQTAVKTDTKTIDTSTGPVEYRFLVIGDPCRDAKKLDNPFIDPFTGQTVTLKEEAPEVHCKGGRLAGAVFSDHGHPILGMFFSKDDLELPYTKATEMAGKCNARKEQGYNSGMGAIFLKVAGITSLSKGPQVLGLSALSDTSTDLGLTRGSGMAVLAAVAVAGVGLVLLTYRLQAKASHPESTDLESIE